MRYLLLFLSVLPLLAYDANFQEGKNIYNTTCISCHGENGETNAEIHLIVKPRRLQETILSQEQSFKVIKYGAHHWGAHADIMPAFKYVYEDKQIHNVALYIATTFNSARDKKVKKLLEDSFSAEESEISLDLGKKIWTKKCSKCHGITGNGESDYVEKSKENDEFIYPYNLTRTLLDEDQIFLYAKHGGKFWGTDKSDMPAWKNKYDDITLRSVARFVKTKIVKTQD